MDSKFEEWEVNLKEEEYNNRIVRMFRMWNARLLRSSAAHYKAAERYSRYETRLSILNIISAILVLFLGGSEEVSGFIANSLFWTFGHEGGDTQLASTIILGTLSFVVVASSATQYIQQFSSKSSTHKLAGNEFSNLRRKVERYWSKANFHPEAVHSLNRSYNMITKYPPMVPSDIWKWSAYAKNLEAFAINNYFFSYPLSDVDNYDEVFDFAEASGSSNYGPFRKLVLHIREQVLAIVRWIAGLY